MGRRIHAKARDDVGPDGRIGVSCSVGSHPVEDFLDSKLAGAPSLGYSKYTVENLIATRHYPFPLSRSRPAASGVGFCNFPAIIIRFSLFDHFHPEVWIFRNFYRDFPLQLNLQFESTCNSFDQPLKRAIAYLVHEVVHNLIWDWVEHTLTLDPYLYLWEMLFLRQFAYERGMICPPLCLIVHRSPHASPQCFSKRRHFGKKSLVAIRCRESRTHHSI